jgi:hypothetical protein
MMAVMNGIESRRSGCTAEEERVTVISAFRKKNVVLDYSMNEIAVC